ncbi:MAG: hypothetical protein OXT07_06120 [bacterium]|nr:hypothetical protein [bacterium]
METPIIVLRTSVLFLVAFMLVLWQYVSHTTRLAADAAAQSAAAAAPEVPDDWGCDPDHPDLLGAGQYQAHRAVQARLAQGGVKAKSVVVAAHDCNIVATVTVGALSARWAGLEHTAAACSAPGQDGPLITTGRC